mgnify:CR=1 FL=1
MGRTQREVRPKQSDTEGGGVRREVFQLAQVGHSKVALHFKGHELHWTAEATVKIAACRGTPSLPTKAGLFETIDAEADRVGRDRAEHDKAGLSSA